MVIPEARGPTLESFAMHILHSMAAMHILGSRAFRLPEVRSTDLEPALVA